MPFNIFKLEVQINVVFVITVYMKELLFLFEELMSEAKYSY